MPSSLDDREFYSVRVGKSSRLRAGEYAPHPDVRKQMIEKAKRVDEDELTGLPNLYAWNKQLDIVSKQRQPFLLFIIDVNDFKNINNSFGHATGDQALKDVAHILTQSFRQGEFSARLHGDEFGVIIECVDTDDIDELVLSIRFRIKEFTNRHNQSAGRKYQLGLSVGSVFSDGPDHDIETLFDSADFAMYRDKGYSINTSQEISNKIE